MSQVQPSKQPPGGGTLAYPNTSLVEDTLHLIKEKPVKLHTWHIVYWVDDSHNYELTFEEGMTWREYFNSKYSKELNKYISYSWDWSYLTNGFRSYSGEEMAAVQGDMCIGYELDENENVIVRLTAPYVFCSYATPNPTLTDGCHPILVVNVNQKLDDIIDYNVDDSTDYLCEGDEWQSCE